MGIISRYQKLFPPRFFSIFVTDRNRHNLRHINFDLPRQTTQEMSRRPLNDQICTLSRCNYRYLIDNTHE